MRQIGGTPHLIDAHWLCMELGTAGQPLWSEPDLEEMHGRRS